MLASHARKLAVLTDRAGRWQNVSKAQSAFVAKAVATVAKYV